MNNEETMTPDTTNPNTSETVAEAEAQDAATNEGMTTPPTADIAEAVEETQETQPTSAKVNVPAQVAAADVAAAEAKAQEYMEGWQRERATFTNYKKRAEKELRESRQKGVLDTLVQLLPIIDDFERAMSNLPPELAAHSWLNGVSLIQRKFQKLLDDNQVTVIDPRGQVFDPSRHEAIGMDQSGEVESGHVTATLQKGYICGDQVLRPALVRVAE